MGDIAGRWLRVSTSGQDERSQVPDIDAWCDAHTYITSPDTVYVLHGASASKGKQDKMFARVLDDIRTGKITVLVVWKLDRLDRRGILQSLRMVADITDAGGRVEFVTEPQYNGPDSELNVAFGAHMAKLESKTKSDRIKANHAAKRAAGSVVGRPAWGFAIETRGNVKVLVPTATGRTWIPEIFRLVIAGETLRSICQKLDAAGVKTMTGKPWNEGYLGNRLIKNPTYYGERPNSGELETEALVSFTTWQEANAVLSSRARPGRGTVRHEKTLLAPVCGNAGCDATGAHPSPMYRIFVGNGANRQPYYRCYGRGPQRRGCGFMVSVAELDARAVEAFTIDDQPFVDREFVPGDDRSDEIGRLRERGAEAMRKGDYPAAMAAMQQAAQIESEPRQAAHWAERPTGKTRGQHFASLDVAGQRDYIAKHQVSVTRLDDGTVSVRTAPREFA